MHVVGCSPAQGGFVLTAIRFRRICRTVRRPRGRTLAGCANVGTMVQHFLSNYLQLRKIRVQHASLAKVPNLYSADSVPHWLGCLTKVG